jgi:rod shape-determining protein MreB
MERGIVLSGGGALLRGLDRRIAIETQTHVHIADDPLTAVAKGAGMVLEDLDLLSNVLLPKELKR